MSPLPVCVGRKVFRSAAKRHLDAVQPGNDGEFRSSTSLCSHLIHAPDSIWNSATYVRLNMEFVEGSSNTFADAPLNRNLRVEVDAEDETMDIDIPEVESFFQDAGAFLHVDN